MKIPYTIVLSAVLMALAGCNGNMHSMLPGEVTGEWTSDDPRYQGRFLELSPTFVITGTGPGQAPRVEWIDKVEVIATGNDTQFKVYTTELSLGTHDEMNFFFNSANGGQIRFRNQPRVWNRGRQPGKGK